jgi:RNA polymerase sigma factor (sigma-70 family)
MRQWNDADLLSAYANRQSEEAFGVLVERYVALVYSAALRQVQNPSLAEEVTQAAFTILAQKARGLNQRTVLSGWLCRTAHFVARNALKAEFRRQYRETEAHMQSLNNEPEAAVWQQFAPLLDEAVAQLNEADRNAVVLRFYEKKPLNEVGEILGIDADAAQKRVSRALEKLRNYFAKRGVDSTAAAIGETISANSVQAAPAALAKTVSAVAVAKGAAASTSTLTLIKGALKIMAWTKAKTAVMAGAVVLLAVGTTTVAIKEVQQHHRYPWQVENADAKILERVPPQVMIVPTIFTPTQRGFNMSNNKMLGMGQTVSSLLGAAYQLSRYRVIYLTTPPTGNYDFIANLRTGDEANRAALRQEIEKQFHLVARKEIRETDVLVLTVKSRNAPGLKSNPSKSTDVNSDAGAGYWRASNTPSGNIAGRLERKIFQDSSD